MSRSLVLGNGSVLVGIDRYGQIRDFYYDYVGLEDHMTEDSVHKVGVWVDDSLSWLDSGEWNIALDYRHETLSGSIVAINERLGVELHFQDLVYNEKNIFIRKVTVKNRANRKRTIKIFLNHEFRMYGIKKGDTVYYDPEDRTIVHYKGRRIAVIGGSFNNKSFTDYTVGLSNIEGKEGTWRDAEDGLLSKNPIEHGTVDSTIAFEDTVDSDNSFTFYYWIALEKVISDAKKLHKFVLEKTPEHLIETCQNFWNAWVKKNQFNFYGLDTKVTELFKKSLLILRTHVDNTGAIIASGDSEMLQYGRDNYGYVWPRDAAFVSIALDKAGYPEVSRKFFEFSNVVISEEGFYYHKYRSDKSTGSSWHPWIVNGIRQLPIQEDETAIVLIALWEHYKSSKDLEFIENIYNSLINKAASFMLGFRNESNLPFPSYDIWEMKYGIHTYTTASVYGALTAAANFARLLGKKKDEELFAEGALEVKKACEELLFNEKTGYFYKLIDFKEGKILHDEAVDASSFYGMFRFGVLDLNDERLKKSYLTFKSRLSCLEGVGGFARFEGDKYYQASSGTPGNSWLITALWIAQYLIAKAKREADFEEAKKWINWAADRALPSGILSEQVNPATGEQISAAPLSWSHAEFVTTIIYYLERLEELEICDTCFPIK